MDENGNNTVMRYMATKNHKSDTQDGTAREEKITRLVEKLSTRFFQKYLTLLNDDCHSFSTP